MKVKDLMKIECIKQGKTLSDIAREIGITRHNYYFHLNNSNEKIVEESEMVLNLKPGYFKNMLES